MKIPFLLSFIFESRQKTTISILSITYGFTNLFFAFSNYFKPEVFTFVSLKIPTRSDMLPKAKNPVRYLSIFTS